MKIIPRCRQDPNAPLTLIRHTILHRRLRVPMQRHRCRWNPAQSRVLHVPWSSATKAPLTMNAPCPEAQAPLTLFISNLLPNWFPSETECPVVDVSRLVLNKIRKCSNRLVQDSFFSNVLLTSRSGGWMVICWHVDSSSCSGSSIVEFVDE